MSARKQKDFAKKKTKLGKEHLRKYDSKDAKLLANASQLKKKVKVATQSISVNKSSLNVTSRRLTLAELIGKSRHTSDNVRHHALAGILEFVKQFTDESILNLYTIVQVAVSSLNSTSGQVRKQARALLLYLTAEHLTSTTGEDKCSECLLLYLTEVILSSDRSIKEEGYQTIVAIIKLVPCIFSGHWDQLLQKLVKSHPETPSSSHIDCVYLISRAIEDVSLPFGHDLVQYLYGVIDHCVSRNETVTTELGCLTISAMLVRCFKLLLMYAEHIPPDDKKLLESLLYCDLLDFQGLTDKGRQTFELLFSEFVLTIAELAIKAFDLFSKHHLIIAAPLIHLHSIREKITSQHPERVTSLLIAASQVDTSKLCRQSIMEFKPHWRQELFNLIPTGETVLEELRRSLQEDIASSTIMSKRYASYDMPKEPSVSQPPEIDAASIVVELFRDIASTLSSKPEVLYLLALYRGVSPTICLEELSHKETPPDLARQLQKLPPEFKPKMELGLDHRRLLEGFIRELRQKPHVHLLLKFLLYTSGQLDHGPATIFVGRFLSVERIQELTEAELMLTVRILLNLHCHEEVITKTWDIIKTFFGNNGLCDCKIIHQLTNAMLYHLMQLVPTQATVPLGIDEYLMPLHRVTGSIAACADTLQGNLNSQNVDILETLVLKCLNQVMEGIIKSVTVNIWSVPECLSVITKRAMQPFWKQLTGKRQGNTALATMNVVSSVYLLCLQDREARSNPDDQGNPSDPNTTAAWINELLDHESIDLIDPVIINRLPGASSRQEAVKLLCDDITQLLI